MKTNWMAFLERLKADPPQYHRILPPCSQDRVDAVGQLLGPVPAAIEAMLRSFNGAELFIVGIPYVTLFGVTSVPAFSSLEWAPEWYVDVFTPKWRATADSREDDWAIAMTSYGGLVLLDRDQRTKEWDTRQNAWNFANVPLEEWIGVIMAQGAELIREAV